MNGEADPLALRALPDGPVVGQLYAFAVHPEVSSAPVRQAELDLATSAAIPVIHAVNLTGGFDR